MKLREFRESKCLSIGVVSAATGLDRAYLGQIERGASPLGWRAAVKLIKGYKALNHNIRPTVEALMTARLESELDRGGGAA